MNGRFYEALVYAARLHEGQRRKGGKVPYVSHLLAVCALVLEAGGTEDEAIAALLHDGPEDRGGREELERIRATFGDEVAHIVEGCSDSLVDTRVTKKAPWRERKENYLKHLATADASTLLVSVADKLHNARTTERDVAREGIEFFDNFPEAGRAGTLWYYHELLAAYGRCPKDPRREPLLDELVAIVGRLQRQPPSPPK